MVSIRDVVLGSMFATVPTVGYAGKPAEGPALPDFSAPAAPASAAPAAVPHFDAPVAPVRSHEQKKVVYDTQLRDLETDPLFSAWLAKRAAAARKHKPGLNMDKLQNGFMGVIMYKGELCVSENGSTPMTFPGTETPICDLGQYIRAEQNQIMLSEDPRITDILAKRWVLQTQFDTYKNTLQEQLNAAAAAQKVVDDKQDGRLTDLESRVTVLDGKVASAPVAGAVPSAPSASAPVVYNGTTPEVITYALNGDETRKKAFEADADKKCKAWEAATNDKALDEQFKIDVANTLDPKDVPGVVSKYNAAKAAKMDSEKGLQEACLEARAVRNAQKTEFFGRVEENLVGQNAFALGVFGGYEQGFVGGAIAQWNPFANSTPLGGYGSFFVRHLGVNVAGYAVFGADLKSESATTDAGDGWSSRTTIGTVEHPFMGVRASGRIGLLGNATETVVLSLEAGVNALLSSKNTSPSTVTTVEGESRRTEGNPEYQIKVNGYGFGGVQLDLGPVFIQAGANQAGPTESGNVTPYGLVGANYWF